MRLALLTHVSKSLLLGAVAAALVGCETKSFLNPGEVGRYKHESLLLPIVNTLETGIEEPNDEFKEATDVRPEDLVAEEQDYVVGKNDLLNISITDLVGPNIETVKSARVSESGNISLPLIGQVKADGLTEAQLETEIIRKYREAGLMPNAQVSVTVAQALARTFSILGAVARSGQYQITQSDFRILDALVTAGDLSMQGVDTAYVIRRAPRSTGAMPATAPGTTPAAPGAAPADPLAPRSEANPIEYKKVVLLMQEAGANQPADAAGRPAPAGEGRYIIIDGKPVLVGNQGAAAEPAAAAPVAQPAPAAPTAAAQPEPAVPAAEPAPVAAPAAAPVAEPGTTQGFEFNAPSVEPQRIIRIPLAQLRNGELRYNVVIRAQDMIIVPPPATGEYYMDGHVNRTGVYSLTARKINLKQAVAAAGGLDNLAWPKRTEIIRRIGPDREVFARVDLDKVFSGEQPDVYLKPNDVVRVGTNAIAPFLAATRNAFRITYGFGFLYDRNYAPQQDDNDNN